MRLDRTLVLALAVGLGSPLWSTAQESGPAPAGSEAAPVVDDAEVPTFQKPLAGAGADSVEVSPAPVEEPTFDERLVKLEGIVDKLVRELSAARDAGQLPRDANARLDRMEEEIALINGVLEGMASDLRTLRASQAERSSENLAARTAAPEATPAAREARRPTEGILLIHNQTGVVQEYVINGVRQVLPAGDSRHPVPFGAVTVHFPTERPLTLGEAPDSRLRWRQQADGPVLEITLK